MSPCIPNSNVHVPWQQVLKKDLNNETEVDIQLVLYSAAGKVIKEIDPMFESYFQNVDSREYCLSHNGWTKIKSINSYLNYSAKGNGEDLYVRNQHALAKTNERLPIGFKMNFSHLNFSSSKIYWLPAFTKISNSSEIEIVLESILGLQRNSPSPIWLSNYVLPEERKISHALIGIHNEIEELLKKRKELENNLSYQSQIFTSII